MKLQDQVCTLEQAKRLKELGIVQNASMFSHVKYQRVDRRKNVQDTPVFEETVSSDIPLSCAKVFYRYDAFTVAELGIMLQGTAMLSKKPNTLPRPYPTGWIVIEGYYDGQERNHPSEAQARGAMLIHLLESGTATAEEVNQRLQS